MSQQVLLHNILNGVGAIYPFATGNAVKNSLSGKVISSTSTETQFSSIPVPYLLFLEESEFVGRSNVPNKHKNFIKIRSVDLVANLMQGNISNNAIQSSYAITAARIKDNPAAALRHLNSLRR